MRHKTAYAPAKAIFSYMTLLLNVRKAGICYGFFEIFAKFCTFCNFCRLKMALTKAAKDGNLLHKTIN